MGDDTAPQKSKEYVRPMPATWWLKRRTYTLFMVRELTSVFVAGYAIFLLVLVYRARDQQSFAVFVDGLKSPLSVVLHLLVLGMTLYHAITWIELTPKVMVVWRGEERVPARVIAGVNYAAWAVVSIVIFWIALA